MRQNRFLPHLIFRRLHSPCASGVDHRVRFLRTLSDTEPISENFFHRIYAVTRKNIPIAIGFAVITACQLALGICLVTLTAKKGGNTKPLTRKNYFSLVFQASPSHRSPSTRIICVYLPGTDPLKSRIRASPSFMVRENYLLVFILADEYTRFPRVHLDRIFGGKIQGVEAQGSEHFENHRGGCDAVLPGYVHLPFCV